MKKLIPLKDNILGKMVDPFDYATTKGGVIINNNAHQDYVFPPRWFEVVAVGPEQEDVSVGDFVLVAHGRWSQHVVFNDEEIHRLDVDEILAVSDVHHSMAIS